MQKSSTTEIIPQNIARNLTDKKKQGGVEIENLIKKFQASKDEESIRKVLRALATQFTSSIQPNKRRGGLWGLSAACVGLHHDAHLYLDDLIPPILKCFKDQDAKVRFHAVESMYNIAKIMRGKIIVYFEEIFDALCRLCADYDPAVQNSTILLNRLIKDIIIEDENIVVEKIIPLIKERISTNNPYVRQFLIGWIIVLDSVPDINMLEYLPEFLFGLFEMLSGPNEQIIQQATSALNEFLKEIEQNAETVEYGPLVKILIQQSTSPDARTREHALNWIYKFHVIGKEQLLPYNADFLGAIFPSISHKWESIRKAAGQANKMLMQLIKHTNENIDYGKLINVIKIELDKYSVPTRIAALHWLHMLLNKDFQQVIKYIDELFGLLLKILSDPSEEVVLLDLEVLALLSTTETNFERFLSNLVKLFKTDPKLLSKAGFIIRKLSVMLNPEKIFRELAKILLNEPHLEFCSALIQTVNTILLTSKELHDLRALIKKSSTSKEGMDLFTVLYKSWCHNPVSTLSLCLLAKAYDHASELVVNFSEIEVTVTFLVQLDNLVQFLESPIFTELRLHLLEPLKYPNLLKTLYGILMLLPQSEAYEKLSKRLQSVSALTMLHTHSLQASNISNNTQKNYQSLVEHFKQIQSQHKRFQSGEV